MAVELGRHGAVDAPLASDEAAFVHRAALAVRGGQLAIR